ncbi:hypothetical protein HYC85_011125 [Camellia sinensis]|uniref:7-dehydrocholesterol reductase n=1 Tax=Camellia sinensis TaxID=4442 RepID=A0A7J7HLU0_CAMSI|nr:hypothetical protein HYC85_011125 [Camellia sinensis]
MAETKMVHSPIVTYISMICLLTLCPPFVILLWYTMVHADGSISQALGYLRRHGLPGFINIWPKPTAIAWKMIACYAAFEAVLQLFLPGKRVEGPISPAGNRPVYKANGVAAYAVTLITYLSLWWFGVFNPSVVYDHLGEIFSALIFGSFIFCIFLYIKGHVAPSSSDSGSCGNIIIDFYWGMELYPRIGKNFDIKVFTNCRFGMMSWAVLAITYCIKQYEANGRVADSMLVNTILMLAYITKFFWWEDGYWNTMDIAHDRAGFYICWGCLVWVPSVYTSPGMYLVNHPVNLGTQAFYAYTSIMTVTGKGKNFVEQMASAWFGEKLHQRWGLSRHFHYVPEILAAFFWTVPTLFNHFLPYFYVVFLTILLFDRAKRDDDRCRSKYGKYWKLYCEKVPYRIIPGNPDRLHRQSLLSVFGSLSTPPPTPNVGRFRTSAAYGCRNMSSYENVVGGKLKLKGKALDVKAGGVKKKKKQKKHYDEISQVNENELSAGGNTGMATDLNQDDVNDANKSAGEGNAASYDEHLTPAERRYMEQKEQIDVHRLAKISNKSHRDRILDFNQYLANMSEHYDIPKIRAVTGLGNFEDQEAQIPGFGINWNKGTAGLGFLTLQLSMTTWEKYFQHSFLEASSSGVELYPRIGKKFDIKQRYREEFKYHLVDLNIVFTSLREGGLGIRRQRQEFRRTNGKCLVSGKSFIKGNMSACENVVGGKLMLKGKALDVKAGGVKKKKKQKKHYDEISQVNENELSAGGNTGMATDLNQDDVNDANKSAGEGNSASYDEHLTPAERRYMEQKEQIDVHRLAKISNKSHRDRIQDFNWYLANMSEHYDIPKVGPG